MTNYSHSEAVGLLLPAVIKANSSIDEATSTKYNILACNTGFNGISDLVRFLERVSEQAITPERKEEMKQFLEAQIYDETFQNGVKNDRGGKGNPVDLTDEYILNVIREGL